MKRICALVLALVMILSMCACEKSEAVKNVENLISGIGSVTISSFAKIQEAEEAYYALSDEEQTKVKNYKELEKAKKDLESLGVLLTIDNYENYLNVGVQAKKFGPLDYARAMGLNKDIGSYVYTGIELNSYVRGKSSNYDYNDVKVTVKCTGYYVPFSAENQKKINKGDVTLAEYILNNRVDVDETFTMTTDIIGSGSASGQIKIQDGYWILDSDLSVSYEVVAISGFLSK